MNPVNDLLKGQRRLTPPPVAVEQLERQVMARVGQWPRLRRRRHIIAGSAALGCVVMVIVTLVMTRPCAVSATPPDFTESVFVLDNHICIWLEPADSPSRIGHRHE
jgi:hypothetical protein